MTNGSKTVSVGGGVSISTILGIVFIVLKLCGVITWSWVWVLAPFWIPVAIFAVCLLFIFLLGAFKD